MDTRHLAKKIRLHALNMTSKGNSSHIGSILSIADLLAVLYGGILKVDAADPLDPDRDRFVLSKGHAAAGLYAVLAERGFIPVRELEEHCRDGSRLCGHTTDNIPGVEFSTGSLGHGLPVGAGIAFSGRIKKSDHRVFVLMSDGECDEGSNWEAILFAAHHGLENLIAIVDYNKMQSLATTSETLELEPFAEKWSSFGWGVVEIDGHDHSEIRETLSSVPVARGKPSCVIAHTTKGKGVSFMENSVLWHYRSPQGEELEAAVDEVDGRK